MFGRILVGVDDSNQAREALARAIELAESTGARLGILSSAPSPPPLASAPMVLLAVSEAQLERELLDWAQRNVDEAERLVPQQVPVTKLVARGAPAAALLRHARSGEWDLIVVGQSHRRRRLRRPIGERLNRRSPTPVLVVHEDAPEQPAGTRERSRRRRTHARTAPTI